MAQHFQPNFIPIFQSSGGTGVEQQIVQEAAVPTMSPMPPPFQAWAIENMPWAQQRIPTSHSNLMQFEAHAPASNFLHAKRKPDKPTAIPPAKQFITEEKIAAHFNGLHISNNAAASANDEAFRVTAKELEEKLKNAQQIKICEDVLKMHEEDKKISLIPDALLNRTETPLSKALIVWQPPPILELLKAKTKEEETKTNNQVNELDQNNKKTQEQTEDLIEDIEFLNANEFDDFIDNNNTCNLDYNDAVLMDEDL